MTRTVALHLLLFCFLKPEVAKAREVHALWADQAKPYFKENPLEEHEKELWGTKNLFHVTEPTLTVYPAEGESSGRAVLVIPGGGYELVAINHEGYDVAEALSAQGVTAAVLKYRLPNPESSDQPHLVPLADTRRALKLLRRMAPEYGIDPEEVGVLGFSAGSHLATVAGLWKSDDRTENPSYSALIYGVTDLTEDNLRWLEESLYFRKLTEEEITRNRLLELVNEETPPAFLVHAYDDDVCRVEETTLYAQKLVEKGVLVETHLFSRGGHGFGLGRREDGTDQWIDLFVAWITANDL